ncbi:MAG: hypothetical protein AAGD10_15945 [Myxococcota bacterium]
MQTKHAQPFIDNWLDAISNHITVRRQTLQDRPRPKRNREREKARRQARQLFAEYYADLAVEHADLAA